MYKEGTECNNCTDCKGKQKQNEEIISHKKNNEDENLYQRSLHEYNELVNQYS